MEAGRHEVTVHALGAWQISWRNPPTLTAAVPNWRAGDAISLGDRSLRVVAVRDDDADQPPALVVEDVSE